jgi:hypothetical protein
MTNLNAVKLSLQAEIDSLQSRLREVEVAISAANIQAAKEKFSSGWEVRVGHTTGSTCHRDWQSVQGEPWTFLIVPTGTPSIEHVEEFSHYVDVLFSGGEKIEIPDEWGHGETLEEAWESLLENNT